MDVDTITILIAIVATFTTQFITLNRKIDKNHAESVTKEYLDLRLSGFATKQDLAALDSRLSGFATKEYLDSRLSEFATRDYLDSRLSGFATKEDVAALDSRLSGFATKEDVAALDSRLSGFATKEDVAALAEQVSGIAADVRMICSRMAFVEGYLARNSGRPFVPYTHTGSPSSGEDGDATEQAA